MVFRDFPEPFMYVLQDHSRLLQSGTPIKIAQLGCIPIGNCYQKISSNCNLIVFDDNVVDPRQTKSASGQR